jgi:membrane protease YdiL (CAAX protease family)
MNERDASAEHHRDPSDTPFSPEPIEPAPPVRIPSPGLVEAVVWMVVFLIVQTTIAIPLLRLGPQFMLPIATMSVVFAALVITRAKLGKQWLRVVCLRRIGWTHSVCTLLLVPVAMVLAARVAWGVTLIYEAMGVSESALAFSQAFGDFEGLLSLMPFPAAALYVIVFVGLFPAIGEEVFFRGFLGRGLIARYGVASGIVLTSVLFGAMHFHPIQGVATITSGIVFHLVFLWSRSLGASILMHAVNNSILGMLGLIELPFSMVLPSLQDLGSGPLTLAALASLLTLGLLLYRVRVRWILPDNTVWAPGYVASEMPPSELGARAESGHAGTWTLISAAIAYAVFIAVFLWEWMPPQ